MKTEEKVCVGCLLIIKLHNKLVVSWLGGELCKMSICEGL